MERTWTVMEILQWTAHDLAERGSPSARLDAEVLLADVLGMARVGLYLAHDRPLDADERARFRTRIERRRAGEPVAYITGSKEFWGLPLLVDARVLIPRPETELLVEEALAALGPAELGGRALDVGTGSGAIAIALLHERPTLTMDAVDISPDALAVAEQNALRHGVGSRLRLLPGDLTGPVENEPAYDLVTANLPYIPERDIAELAVGVRAFEPHRALAGGPDGLDLIRRLLGPAQALVSSGGALILEVGAGQAPEVEALAARLAGYEPARLRKDYAGIERIVVLRHR